MKPPFRLVRNRRSRTTIRATEELRADAHTGDLIGVALVAMYKRRVYTTRVTGECFRSPTFTRGMLRALDDELAVLMGSVHGGKK